MVQLYLSVNGCLLISSLCIFSIVFIKTEQVANTDNCIIQLNKKELVAQTNVKGILTSQTAASICNKSLHRQHIPLNSSNKS